MYGGKVTPDIEEVRSLSRGDSANVFSFTLHNHWGTHIDAPAHFFREGKTIADISAGEWIFTVPQVIEVALDDGQLLGLSGWEKSINKESDIILFRSGWSGSRDEEKYYSRNPGIAPFVGSFLRENFPGIRAVGIDWISISSILDRKTGREAHRNFLDPEGKGRPILLIEDMDLGLDLSGLARVTALPVIIEGIDSAPCTIIGGFNDKDSNI